MLHVDKPSVMVACLVAILLSASHAGGADSDPATDVQIDAKSFGCIRKMSPVPVSFTVVMRLASRGASKGAAPAAAAQTVPAPGGGS